MQFLELIEGFYHLREPITFSSSKWRISFLKIYTKFFPPVFGVLIAGLVAWAVYSGTELIWLAIGLGIFTGGIGYGSTWLGVWLVRKFFISYISDYHKVFEPKSKPTDKARTYNGLRVFWIFTGIVNAVVVSGVLYYFRGLLGLILSIIVYLPSLVIYLWIIERAMEGRPIIPLQAKYRVVIVLAVILFQISFFWWLLEVGNSLAGWLGIGIASLMFLGMQLYIYFYWRNRKRV